MFDEREKMSTSAIRVLAVAAVAAVSITCADSSATGIRRVGLAGFALAPSFAQAADGGPDIDVTRVRGVLRNGTDSSVADAAVVGDTATLEFRNVPVTGDSTKYELEVDAFDANNVLVFHAEDELQVKPGDNEPAAPVLEYSAPDVTVETIDISVTSLQLDWAGADANDVSCLNRAPKQPSTTQQQLTITGKSAANQVVPNVRVGWTSRDTSVVSVTEGGLVRSRCSNKSTWVVARTFLDKADSIEVTVTAPPFSLVMSPDSTDVERGATTQLTALAIDENNNTVPASQVTWHSSNTTRATVSASGLVSGLNNGRVLITANSGSRTTVGVVNVVRPRAAKVLAIPQVDTLAVGQVRVYYAKAADANNRIIGDAKDFEWSSSNTAVATIGAASGVATAVAVGDASLIVSIDGKKDTVALRVEQARPGGSIKSVIVDAKTDAPLSGVLLQGPNTSTTTAADGSFLLSGLQPGDNITISKTGYVTVTLYDAPVFANYVLQIPDAGLPPAGGTGTVTGKVVNALSGSGIQGITVKAYSGLNAAPSPKRPNVQPVATVSSNSSGIYTFTGLPAGAYTLHFSGTGYSENITIGSAIGGQTETLSNVLLPPASAGAGLVIVLTWGESATNVPADLDAHVTGPRAQPDTGRFHVYNAARAYVSGPDTIAALELDDQSYRGPEVVTLRSSAAPGAYRFYVHNYSGRTVGSSRSLADSSHARVDVYQDNRVVGTFFPPAGQQGTLWKVFEFDGARLFPVNVITHQENATALPMIVGPGASDASDVTRVLNAADRPKHQP